MMTISSMLNNELPPPRPRSNDTSRRQVRSRTLNRFSPSLDEYRPEAMRQLSLASKVKSTVKDATKLERSAVHGDINFPAFSIHNMHIQQELQKFDIYPLEDIMEYPKHIPYTSEKKGFHLQTGRDSFELFQYRFKYNSSKGSEFVVRWDYNIGLVRITPFFKALDHNKTIPAKAIAKTEGLREMSHSITGGSLDAQGYWMPFVAARALAATFCWPIRYALTPLFGSGFPDICIKPSDPAFQDYKLSREVIRHCQEEVRSWTQPKFGRHVSNIGDIIHNDRHNYSHTHTQIQASRRRQSRTTEPLDHEIQAIDNDMTPKALRFRTARPHYAESGSLDSSPTPRASEKHHTRARPSTSTWRAVNSPVPSYHMHTHSSTQSSASPAPSSVLFSVAGSEESGSGVSKRSFDDGHADTEDMTFSNPTSPDMSRGQSKRRKMCPVEHIDAVASDTIIGQFEAAEVEAARALVLFAGHWGKHGQNGVQRGI